MWSGAHESNITRSAEEREWGGEWGGGGGVGAGGGEKMSLILSLCTQRTKPDALASLGVLINQAAVEIVSELFESAAIEINHSCREQVTICIHEGR